MDLIDREELLKRFELTSQANGNAIRYEIKCAPTVDAEPVRRGKWLMESDGGTRCSACKGKVHDVTDGSYAPVDLSELPYCPKCGSFNGGSNETLTAKYILRKNNEVLEFMSEKDACEFLGVKKCSVASCYRRGTKCKGYTIERVGITTHHATKTRMYKIWQSMHERCEREKHEHYENYGGRGITVCEEWHEFEPFRDWAVASGYSDKLSIDRINTDGNYCPENCRWVTMKEQQNNKRNNRRITYNGETHTITEWSEITCIKKTTIKERLNMGWSNEKTLTTPVRRRARVYTPYSEKKDGE